MIGDPPVLTLRQSFERVDLDFDWQAVDAL